jgi:hypothetical protein
MREVCFLLVLVFWLFLCYLVGRAAMSYHRSMGVWFVLAVLLSPLVAGVCLLIAGDCQEALARQEREERLRQKYPGRTDLHEAAMNALHCHGCGAEVNPITGDGLTSSETEPWLLICARCQTRIEPEV